MPAGPNLDHVRAVLRAIEDDDPHADVRRQVIAGEAGADADRLRAVALLRGDLLRDPSDLMSTEPPGWLVELSRNTDTGVSLLFDGRLDELARRAVDDVLGQGCELGVLLDWLEARATTARDGAPD